MFALKRYILNLTDKISAENAGVYKMHDAEFEKTFGLRKKTVRALVKEFSPLIAKPRRNDASVETEILLALAFYATGSYNTLVRQNALYNVSQTTASTAVIRVTEALNKFYEKYVTFPIERSKRDELKTKFFQKFSIPDVVGCIGRTHVSMIKPSENEELDNKMGFHSLYFSIVYDVDGNIIYVDAEHPGCADESDSMRKYQLSVYLSQLNADGEQCFILADSDNPLYPTLKTPILDAVEGSPDHLYNLQIVAALQTVRHSGEELKARFKCLLAECLDYDSNTISAIIKACCMLHNIVKNTGVPW